MNVIPVRSSFPKVDDEQLAQAVLQLAHEREQRKLDRMMREWSGRSHGGIRGVRMPDGTRLEFVVPREAYMYWAVREGVECWEDAGFVHEFLRDNPQCRVRAEAVNALVGWSPMSEKAKAYRRQKARVA
jgi:hypothetical protein